MHCNDIAPPRYKVGGKWYCSYPELRECHDPAMLPVDEVKIEPVNMTDIGLGKSIYTKKQFERRPLSWPTWARTRKESGAGRWVPRHSCPSSTLWG
jgi:hypothetical protein